MAEDEITIRLMPFRITGVRRLENDLQSHGAAMREEMSVPWCVLPDILYGSDSKEFVGLSFLLKRSHYSFVRDLVSQISDPQCRYAELVKHPDRYNGFGDNDRLELYWSPCHEEVMCELASLDTGAWIYKDIAGEKPCGEIPWAYELLAVAEIKDGYGLK